MEKETIELDPTKQYLSIQISVHTSTKWKLFVSFSVRYFGPNSELWGVYANLEHINTASVAFDIFYKEACKKTSEKIQMLYQEDLKDTGIYVELLQKKSDAEDAKIDIWFENISRLMELKQWHGPERQPSPPYEAYRMVGHNELNIGPEWEKREWQYYRK